MRWTVVMLASFLGTACVVSQSQTSSTTSSCCVIEADAANASCWCESATSGSGVSYSTKVTGQSCEVTFTFVSDAGTTTQTVQGMPPASAAACAEDLPGA
jgi:hypothetical protein